jgi:hypothetical protein
MGRGGFRFGAGRPGQAVCTDTMLRLDVRQVQRTGVLVRGHRFSWQWKTCDRVDATIDCIAAADRVLLDYRVRTIGGEWESLRYPVLLDWTPCTFGGRRVWWRCPASGCGRRVAVLFGARLFACRHCHRLAYRSQSESAADRALRRASRIRDRLGWEPGIINPMGSKPKGMHWRTFERLEREHFECARRAVDAMMAQLEAMHHPPIG